MTAKLVEMVSKYQFAIQVISICWSKRSRGAPAADRRNQIPRAFALSMQAGSFQVIERRDFHETPHGEFACLAVRTGIASILPCKVDGLLLEMQGNQLLARLQWDKHFHGMPKRYGPTRPLCMAPGETAQIIINGRHSAEAQWYTQHCYNIAFAEKMTQDAFVRAGFEHVLSLEANLF
ncbi:hypothetical protein ACO0LF_23165 [Undibacterium sp. Di27W]|uniref:hypothetical protein n=1 Tax=Undibacterium sp. Di27W TaxID=3413036 RepID=UPI003BEF5A54